MSEDEAIQILKTISTDNFCMKQIKIKQAIETILDLYNKVKEENKELSEELTERICKNVEAEVFEEMRLELKQEKEKNKELREELDRQINTRIINEEFIEKNYISKDKIREEIKELENMKVGGETFVTSVNFARKILKELLDVG